MAQTRANQKRGNMDDEPKSLKKTMNNNSGAQAGVFPTAYAILESPSDLKDFVWDQVIKYACAAVIALSLLELLTSIRGDTLQCFPPKNYSLHQHAFMNSYCSQFTPLTDYFIFYLVGQAAFIFGLHYVWSSWFSGKFRYFLSLASSLERHREPETAEFSLNNVVISRTLLNSFQRSLKIYLTYISKLFAQWIFSGLFIFFDFYQFLFGDYRRSFECPPKESPIPSSWPLTGVRAPCFLTSLIILEVVRYLNVILLAAIVVSATYGLVWCLKHHKTTLNWNEVAKFSFESGMPPSVYKPKSRFKRYCFPKYCFSHYRIKSDFDFLFLSLYRDDAGITKVLREVLIADCIKLMEKRALERLWLRKKGGRNEELLVKQKLDTQTTRKSKIENIIRKTGDPTIRPPPSIDDNSCRGILTKIFQELGLDYVVAVDIAFGTSGYKLQLCSRADRLLALDLNPHYQSEDEKKLYKMDKYLWYFKSVCTSANIFSEEESRIEIFKNKVLSEAGIVDQDTITKKVNVVVVGPILTTEARRSTSQKGARLPNMAIHRILQLLDEVEVLNETAYLITFTPVAINGDASVALQFANFVPSWSIDGLSSPVVACRRPRSNRCGSACGCCVPEDATDLPVRIPCGQSYCDFDVKVYKIPLDSLPCARKQSQQDRASSSEIGSEVENDCCLPLSPQVTVTHNDLQLPTNRLQSSVARAESQCDRQSVTVTEV